MLIPIYADTDTNFATLLKGLVFIIAQSHFMVKVPSDWPVSGQAWKEWLIMSPNQVQRGDLVLVWTCNFWPISTDYI